MPDIIHKALITAHVVTAQSKSDGFHAAPHPSQWPIGIIIPNGGKFLDMKLTTDPLGRIVAVCLWQQIDSIDNKVSTEHQDSETLG